MNDNTSHDEQADATAPTHRKPLRTAIIILLIHIAAGVAWWLLLSPQAQIKRTVSALAESFEQQNADAVMAHFSQDYSDPAGNTFDDMDTVIRDMILPLMDDITIDIERTRVSIEDGQAVAVVYGKLSYKIQGIPRREIYDEETPALLSLRRQDGAWKIVSVENIGSDIADMETTINELRDML